MLLAQNKDGWGVPISIDFQVANIGMQDCGLVARLKG